MPVTWQKFKCGSIERELDLVSSQVPHEPSFIYVDDVLEAFKIRDADRFEYDGRTITYLRNDKGAMYHPKRIPCRPGCVIQVVHEPQQSGTTSSASTIVPGTYSDESLPAEYRKRFTTPVTAIAGFERTVISKLDEHYDQGAVTQQQIAQAVLKLQKQMNDRLILIQSKTKAILTQQLELAEYPIPRFFIVLPEESVKYDPGNWFRTKFRLHFICECGKHTEASKLPHHLHLVKHEGYLVREPTEFFKKYGPLLLLMLELIKFGTNIAGHVVPTLDSLKAVGLVDPVEQTIGLVTAKIDYSLECIGNQLAKVQAFSAGDIIDTEPRSTMTQQGLTNYLSDVKGLEGVELRQLGSFLKTSEEENLFGNLYRTTTSDGHVKWLCRDHYQTSYQEKYVHKLRDVVKLAQGEFDEQLGKITVTLTSSFAAAEFYAAISKSKGVLELILRLSWRFSGSDLQELKDALKETRVSILQLDLRQFRTNVGGKSLSARNVLLRIMEHPKTTMIHVVLPKNLINLTTFPLKRPFRIRKLSFETVPGSIGRKEFGVLSKTLKVNSALTHLSLFNNVLGYSEAQALSGALKKNSTLTTLNLTSNSIGDDAAEALSEALKINSTLTTLNLQSNSIRDNGAQALSEALKTNATLTTLDLRGNRIGFRGTVALVLTRNINSTLTALDLRSNSIGGKVAKTLYEALKTNSTLTTLDLQNNSIRDSGAQALSEALKTNSTLTTLNLQSNSIGDKGAQALSEALKINSTLNTLNLRSNSIGSKGAQALSKAIKVNSTLKDLKF